MLLGMGNDPNPVESGTRGTVRVVDDIGTLHCDFDNGRSLGVVPGEDSFRKLTDEELAEEQYVDMDEDEAAPLWECEAPMGERLEIEIPPQLTEPLLQYASETELPWRTS